MPEEELTYEELKLETIAAATFGRVHRYMDRFTPRLRCVPKRSQKVVLDIGGTSVRLFKVEQIVCSVSYLHDGAWLDVYSPNIRFPTNETEATLERATLHDSVAVRLLIDDLPILTMLPQDYVDLYNDEGRVPVLPIYFNHVFVRIFGICLEADTSWSSYAAE